MTQDAVSSLRELIVMGALPPGAPLRLDELARMLDMSISPVREAVRQLEVLGLAEHVAYKGARVTYLSVEELHIVHDARVSLETLAVRHTAVLFDEELEGRIRECIERIHQAFERGDHAGVVHGNTAYHVALAQGCGSVWLAKLVGQVLEVWERYSAALILIQPPEKTFAVEDVGHRTILEACREHDADAAEKELREHLAASKAIFERGAQPALNMRQRHV
jgi:DNA-binding GntR family transcriptional regulator